MATVDNAPAAATAIPAKRPSSSDDSSNPHRPIFNPNAIPPRSSSHGMATAAAAGPALAPPQKSVLRPLPENDWLGHTKRASQSSPTPLSSILNPTPTYGQQQQQQPAYGPSLTPPPPEPPKDFGDWFIFQRQAEWPAEKEKVVLGPFEYLYGHPGKDFRAQLIEAFNAWLNVPEESLHIITRVVGMLHTASLLVDDVEDQSVLRRGIPVAHSIFGTAQTINSANYTYFLALREISKLSNPHAIEIYTEELLNLHRGQGMDLFWRDTLTCPSEADYLEMVGYKTGGLFRLAIKLMQAESSAGIDCVPLINTVSLLFQILDDYKNLLSPVYSSQKGLCEDLTEGKFSFPVIHAVRADASNRVLLNILKMKPTDDAVKHYAVDYMQRVGSFAYCRRVIAELVAKAERLAWECEARVRMGDEAAAARGMEGVKGILGKMKVEG